MEQQFVLFWKPQEANGIYSQWYLCDMTIDGIVYCCNEQYMMAEKARLFGDVVVLAKIMATRDPAEMRRLGRIVSGFNQQIWDDSCVGIVTDANYHKFSQNVDLRDQLLATGNATIVEASPRDTIWGIGLGASNPAARVPASWRGKNLLGIAIMAARERIAA